MFTFLYTQILDMQETEVTGSLNIGYLTFLGDNLVT